LTETGIDGGSARDEPTWTRVKAAFQAVLAAPDEAREQVYREACGDDAALRREVETLVAAHGRADAFLETPAGVDGSSVGRRLGPYRLLAEIGRGGMGTVYRAVREDDTFRKEVAIKLVRGSEQDLGAGRFRRERQILARLQHPNIAAVHDGGTSDDGRPYLVMELIDGEPLDRYCASRALSLRERVALMRTVCDAVHHAHQALVVHRDLKPGNILVGRDGAPKLLDFGIAKLLANDDTGEDRPTATLLPLLTPEYASPEQVRGQPITTASDVYSLGVVLYELLTGGSPYTFATRGLDEVVRVVCGSEPPRPSASVRPGTAATARQLAGDLDTIVLRCLQKEPARRYASAIALADDLQRYLDGRPLLARPDSLRYRAGKFVLRHRLGVAAGAVAVLGLLTGTVVAWRQARIAETNRQRAERRFQDVRRLAGALLFDLHDQIANLPGALAARKALVSKAEEYLETLAREAEGDRDLQRELAGAYQRLGDVYGGGLTSNLGDSDAALASYERARRLREALGRAPGSEPRDVEELALLQFGLGALYRSRAQTAEAEAALADSVRLLEQVLANGGASGDARRRLAGAYQRLGEVQGRQGRGDDATASIARAVALAEAHVKGHPADTAGRITLAAAYYAHAEGLAGARDLAGALGRLEAARAILEALRQEDPLNTKHARLLGFTLNGEGNYHLRRGENAPAIAAFQAAVALAEEMTRGDPHDRYARLALAVANRALGATLASTGDVPGGLRRLRSARATVADIVRDDPSNGFASEELRAIDYYVADVLLRSPKAADRAEGCRGLSAVVEAWEQLRAEGRLPSDATTALPRARTRAAACARG
jgi:tRNA A-37 threonylcarbamoyl transferase component Bud32/tetratricopeptide (TPR) repeat protein